MSRKSQQPSETLHCLPFLPDDFVDRLEYLKRISQLTWDGMAYCMGVDPRQLRRWRHGAKPCGDALFGLFTLAARFPGGVHILLGTDIPLPEQRVRDALAEGIDFRGTFRRNVTEDAGSRGKGGQRLGCAAEG